MAQVVERLLCKEKVLNPNPSTTRKKEAGIRRIMIKSQLLK
jgi:hypothetical protein